jgi:DNA-binding CsgD family transcriptional regulator
VLCAGEQTAASVFVDRAGELARFTDVVTRVRAGEAWLVTVEGESGIGKSALARRFLDAAEGFTVLSARADPAETDLDYGIVGQLLRRVDRASLSGYPLLAVPPPGSSPFGVGAQLLGLVGELQASKPLAVFIDDVQWADRKSVEALTFVLRRLTVDPVLGVVVFRGNRDQLGETAHRLVISVEQRLRVALTGLRLEDVAPLAEALGAGRLDDRTAQRVYQATAGHALYLQTVLSEGVTAGLGRSARLEVPPSLAAALADQLAVLSADTRAVLEMLAVVNGRLPAARLGDAAGVESASAAIEPAVAAGLVDWWPQEASCPVAFRHALQRDAIYVGMAATNRRALHARAVPLVDGTSAWAHKVAALDGCDEELAGELENAAAGEAASGMLPLAATHLLWAADISAARAGRERRLLTAANHLMLADEARGLELRDSVAACEPSPLRDCVLGTMAFASGQLGDAELRLTEALARARAGPGSQPLAAIIANRLAGTYTLLGDGQKVIGFGSWALATATLNAAADSQTRTLVAIGTSQVGGAQRALAALAHLADDPARIDPVHVDGLSFRGVFRLLAGDLPGAVRDLTVSLRMARQGVTFTLGLRAYFYLALAQYLSGAWDEVLLTADQGFSAAAIHPRRYELPLLHLAAGCVPAGRGATVDAERHAAAAEEAAATLDYGQERLYAGMMRALLCQSRGDYAGMAAALDRWLDEAMLDGRSRVYGVLWRPLLVEGLIGSGRLAEAAAALGDLQAQGGQVSYLRQALAWLEGWMSELRGDPEAARRSYEHGEEAGTGDCPVHAARLLLAHGRLLRRTGNRRGAIDRLRRASALYAGLRAEPFAAQAEEELAACGLPQRPGKTRPVLAMTDRETEVAHLVARGLTNVEVGAELFITPKAVEYHLGNIYAKFGLKGRQQLRRHLGSSLQTPTTAAAP